MEEVEGDGDGSGGCGGEVEGVEEGPVVGGPLVAEHPVDNRAGFGSGGGCAGVEDPDPPGIDGGNYSRCHWETRGFERREGVSGGSCREACGGKERHA